MKKLITLFFLFIQITACYTQWIEQVSGVSVSLNCVSSVYSGYTVTHGWICGNNGTVLKTTNGGTNWINVSSGIPSTVNLSNIIGLTGLNSRALVSGVIAGNTAVVYRTSNGGVNWQNILSIPNGNIYGIVELGTSEYLLMIGKPVGGRWSIWRSFNYGVSWDSSGLRLPQSGGETGFNNSVFSSDEKVWFGTNSSHIYYSSDAGISWVQQSTLPESNSSVVWFQYLITEAATGYGLTSGSGMLKTTNLGINWSPISIIGSGIISGIAGSSSEIYKCWYSRGSNIYVGYSGTNWELQYTAPGGVYNIISNNKLASDNVWAVRDNGGISKYTGTIGISIISNEIPETFSLSQNYPNPFNPTTIIRFAIPSNVKSEMSNVKIIIYDALGREVQTLVNGNLSPGTYEVDFDGSNLTSGVYYYKLISDSFTETKRMVLIK
jgi:hypothetical protein